jgi:hypothetical protein
MGSLSTGIFKQEGSITKACNTQTQAAKRDEGSRKSTTASYSPIQPFKGSEKRMRWQPSQLNFDKNVGHAVSHKQR